VPVSIGAQPDFETGPLQSRVSLRGPKGDEMATGTVKWFNPAKHFGFIQPEDGSSDVFVHVTAVEAAGLTTLREGQRVEYELENDEKGKVSATGLNVLD
jgi:CspA family cold shock protein